MSEVVCDVVVLGLGVGGEEIAGRLAEAGLEVVGIESHLVGGECPYYACIPTKMMLRGAELLAEGRRINGLAGVAQVNPDYTEVARRISDVATNNWNDRAAVERLESKGGTLVRGTGRLVESDRVQVEETIYAARRGIVLAVGTSPTVPPIPGLSTVDFWTNRDATRASELPKSLIVLGGGAVGVELSQAFVRFGVKVTLIEASDRILPVEEPEASKAVAAAMEKDGVQFYLNTRGGNVRRSAGGTSVSLNSEQNVPSEVEAERLLVALGRRPNLENIGLDVLGLAEDDLRSLTVDGRMRLANGVWAVGDITGHGMFTHVAVRQAEVAAADILGLEPDPVEYHGLAWTTFTDPEIGRVGMTEQQARDAGLSVRVASVPVKATSRGWIQGISDDGLIKLVEDQDRGVLVGATTMGPCGGEVLSLVALAVHGQVPVSILRTMHFAFPTFHRGVRDALVQLTD